MACPLISGLPIPACSRLVLGDDGWIFAGSYKQAYVFDETGKLAEKYPYTLDGGLAFNATFRLSPDGRFLIRSCFSPFYGGNDLLLQDLKSHGREMVLARAIPPACSGLSVYPESLAVSALNRLVAVLYADGLLLVFDLCGGEKTEARMLAQSLMLLVSSEYEGLYISFDGFDRVNGVSYYDHTKVLVHTLHFCTS